jgi:PAS domain S-box-containing protein
VSTRALVGVWTLALLAAAGAVAIVVTSDHALDKEVTIALAVPTGLAFIGSGLAARRRYPANRTGLLLILVGFTWFLGALPVANNALLFTIGLVVQTAFIGFLAYLFLAFPSGELRGRTDRGLTVAMFAVVVIGPLVIFSLDEGEITDTYCEGGPCPDNLLESVAAQPVANAVGGIWAIGAAALSVTVAVRLIRRWRRATPALRRALNPVVVTAGFLIAAFAVQIAVGLFSSQGASIVNWIVLGAMLAVPLAFLYGLMRPQLTAWSRRLAAELAEQRRPEQVQSVLRGAVRDPSLEVGYRASGEDGYVGVDGAPLKLPEPGSGRMVTRIGDEVIVHDASLRHQPELEEMLDAAHIALERGFSLRSLETSERRAQALIEAIPDNVYWVARDGRCLACLHAKDPLGELGFDRLVGSTITAALPPAIATQLLEGLERALTDSTVETIEFRVDDDGRERDTEVRIVRAAPDEAVMIFRDVTDRKRQERELVELASEQAALSRVAVAVATEKERQQVFDVVSEEVGLLFRAQGANLARFVPGRYEAVVVGRWGEAGASHVEIGEHLTFDGPTPFAQVIDTGGPVRLDTLDDIPGERAQWMRDIGVKSVVAAPVFVGGRLWGSVVVSSTEYAAFPAGSEERLEKFASLVAVAIANAEASENLAASRARIVRAGDEERRRLERNLHDGAQQRLVTLSLALRLAQSKLDDDPGAARGMLDSASSELAQALEELRELARGIHPAILSDRGLGPALEALAARTPVPVRLENACDERFPAPVEAAAYYVVAESLTNVAKYADAQAAHVRVVREDGIAVVEVEDDGVGGADASRGSGLRGLADRVEALEGRLTITSANGRGTRVRAEIPLGSGSA